MPLTFIVLGTIAGGLGGYIGYRVGYRIADVIINYFK